MICEYLNENKFYLKENKESLHSNFFTFSLYKEKTRLILHNFNTKYTDASDVSDELTVLICFFGGNLHFHKLYLSLIEDSIIRIICTHDNYIHA